MISANFAVGFINCSCVTKNSSDFKALIPLNIKWFGQGSVIISRDKELLSLAAKSGCLSLYIGFESLSAANLKQVGKGINLLQDYKTAIKKIHDSGIGIVGAFIFGFDADDLGVFEEIVDFMERNQIELASFAILTPFLEHCFISEWKIKEE